MGLERKRYFVQNPGFLKMATIYWSTMLRKLSIMFLKRLNVASSEISNALITLNEVFYLDKFFLG